MQEARFALLRRVAWEFVKVKKKNPIRLRCKTNASCEQSACPRARARALLSAAKMFGSWLLLCSKWALIVSSSCFVRFWPLEIFWRPLTRHLGAGVTCDGSEDDGKTGSSPVLRVNPLHKQTTQHTGRVRLSSCLPSFSLYVKPQSSESTMYSNTTYFPTSQLPTLTLAAVGGEGGTSCSLVNEPHAASAQRSAWSGGFSQSSTK